MSNTFLALPVSAADGPGTTVDVSALGASKTVVVVGNGGAHEPYVQIQVSCATSGDDWTTVYQFLQAGSQTLVYACVRMRAVIQNYVSGGAPTVNVGGETIDTVAVELVAPSNNGTGAAVDVSTMPPYKTVQVIGTFKGSAAVQVSNDGGTSWSQADGFAFNKAGVASGILIGQLFRVARSGIRAGQTPGLPIFHVAATTFGGGNSIQLVERTPLALSFPTIETAAALPCFQPPSMLTLNDTFTNPSLARFTTYSENAHAIVPTIAGNQITFVGPSGVGDWNTILAESSGLSNNGLLVPQFAVQMRIASVVSNAGNAYENIGVGIVKDANNFMIAVWQRKEAPAKLAIQVKIGGAGNFRGSVNIGAVGAAPFRLGLSLVSNTLVAWTAPDDGSECSWTARTSWELTEIDMRSDVLTNGASWKPCMSLAQAPTQTLTVSISSFRFGSYGTVGIRDMVPETNEDGTVIDEGGTAFRFTGTFMDPLGAAYCVAGLYDLISRTITMTGVIFVSRGGKLYNDTAACAVDDGIGGHQLLISTWGNATAGYTADQINILYKQVPGDVLTGVNVIAGMTQLALPNIPGGGGSYDPGLAKEGDNWFLAYTVGPVAPISYYPALATSTDLATYTSVRAATADVPYEGTRITRLAGDLWVLAGSLQNYNVYDISMTLLGKITSPLQPESGTVFPPHPTLIPLGKYVYLWNFDNTELNNPSGAAQLGTEGRSHVYRGDRYIPYIV